MCSSIACYLLTPAHCVHAPENNHFKMCKANMICNTCTVVLRILLLSMVSMSVSLIVMWAIR